MARRAKAAAEEVVVEGLRGIEDQIEGLLETFEIVSDKKFLENVKESLREAEKGRGRSIKAILADLSRA